LPYQHFYLDNLTGSDVILEKGPVLLYSGFVYEEPFWYYQEHSHPFCEIVYLYGGSGYFIINGKPYTATKGDILIYNAGALHEERSVPSDPLKTYFCGINNIKISGLKEEQIIPDDIDPIIGLGDYSVKFERYISDIVMESSAKIKGYETVCSNLLSSIIIFVLRIIGVENKESSSDELFPNLSKSVKKHIDNFYSQDLCLSELAKRFYISKDYLSHVFKMETGFSPIKYLILRRIEEAKKLLSSTELSVNEISSAVGYEDSNYFSVIFKKFTGFSPVKYRNSQKKK